MRLQLLKLVVAVFLPGQAILLQSDAAQGEGSGSDNDFDLEEDTSNVPFVEEGSSSNVLEDDVESIIQHPYFETGSTIGKEESSSNVPDDVSEVSSCPPVCKQLPSGHIVQLSKQNQDDIESLFTRATAYDQKDPKYNEKRALTDELNQLFTACVSGDARLVRRVLENPDVEIDVNHLLDYGEDENSANLRLGVQTMVSQGQDQPNFTPLILASYHGHATVVQELLACSEIHINKRCIDTSTTLKKDGTHPPGDTALTVACKKGHTQVVRVLLGHPAIDVNQGGLNDIPPLGEAAIKDNTECVRLLLAHPKINVNLTSWQGYTALWYACHFRKKENVGLLLDHPDIDANFTKRRDHGTPLMAAKGRGYNELEIDEADFERDGQEIIQMLEHHIAKEKEQKQEKEQK